VFAAGGPGGGGAGGSIRNSAGILSLSFLVVSLRHSSWASLGTNATVRTSPYINNIITPYHATHDPIQAECCYTDYKCTSTRNRYNFGKDVSSTPDSARSVKKLKYRPDDR